jgi:hypothetical protein
LNKEDITINSIEKNFDIFTFVSEPPLKTLISININFDFKSIHNANINIPTKETLSEEQIKDKIIEVLQ